MAWCNWHFANSTSPARSHLSTGCAIVQTMMPRQRDYGWRSQVEAEDNCRERRHIPSSNLDCKVSTYQRPSNGRRGVLIRFATRPSLETTCANNYRPARIAARLSPLLRGLRYGTHSIPPYRPYLLRKLLQLNFCAYLRYCEFCRTFMFDRQCCHGRWKHGEHSDAHL